MKLSYYPYLKKLQEYVSLLSELTQMKITPAIFVLLLPASVITVRSGSDLTQMVHSDGDSCNVDYELEVHGDGKFRVET